MGVVAFVAVVVAVAAPLCGHQTQPFPLRTRRKAWATTGPRTATDAPLAP